MPKRELPAKMYDYRPPKSAIWGHSLGRFGAGRAHELVQQFLSSVVGACEFRSASVFPERDLQITPLGHRLLEIADGHPRSLTIEQSEQGIGAIAAWEEEHDGHPKTVALVQHYELSSWRVDDRLVPTESLLRVHYGMLPCMTTMFQFDSLETFERVREGLAELGLCRLNPKHLKPRHGNSRS